MQLQRWFLLISAIVFLAAGCFTVAMAFGETLSFSYIALGLFYWLVGNMSMLRHISDVAGDWDDEEPWASY